MPAIPTYGRTGNSGPAQSPGRSNAQAPQQAPYTLAQTLPSAAPPARFRPPQVSPVPAPRTGYGQSGRGPWRAPENAQDGLIFRDRHAVLRRGSAYTGTTQEPGAANTLNAGPVRPDLNAVNRTWNYQVGTGAAYADDLARGYTGLGEKGTPWMPIYGGTPGFYRLGPGGIPVGDPAQGPGKVFSGPPHGYHTYYPPQGQQTQATYRARPQMVPARVDRLSNSRIAGQNYSQWTQHQGGGRQ